MSEKKIDVMRGEPVKVKICGKEVTVKKLSITKKLDLIDLWKNLAPDSDKDMRQSTKFMMEIIAFTTGISLEEIDEKSEIVEIAETFKVLYERELTPLLEGVGKLNEVIKSQE